MQADLWCWAIWCCSHDVKEASWQIVVSLMQMIACGGKPHVSYEE